jgi:hypothetical protein
MARSVVSDLLQVYPFWLLDAYPIEPLALPILTPLFGFSSITAPEITLETMDITEGNWFFKKKVIKNADVGNITLERGVSWYDSDFWRWIVAAMTGDLSNSKLGIGPVSLKIGGITPRRTLMLVQFFTRPMIAPPTSAGGAIAATLIQGGLATGGAALAGATGGQILASGLTTALIGGIGNALAGFGIGPFEFAARIPAKAWMLHGALPIRYKVGGDFDASSSAISLMQCELAVEMVEEIALLG